MSEENVERATKAEALEAVCRGSGLPATLKMDLRLGPPDALTGS
jgi:hypothetical protein